MILLDHNIPQNQVQLLRGWRVHCRQVGYEIGRPEWDDAQEILRFLRQKKKTTFFTRDVGFFQRRLCHRRYCIVVLVGPVAEIASSIRLFLKLPDFRTQAQRCGNVVRLAPATLTFWQVGRQVRQKMAW